MSYAVPPTRTAAVVRQLRNEIVTGELSPGTLIKDAELAARLGVSITPVREAIAQLSVEGLIDIAPNRTRHVTRLTQKNALELIDVMSVLACAGFEWGIDNLTATHFDLMRHRQREFEAALRDGNVLAAGAAGADFSTIVIMASGNRELQPMVDLVVARTMRILAGSTATPRSSSCSTPATTGPPWPAIARSTSTTAPPSSRSCSRISDGSAEPPRRRSRIGVRRNG
jgi:DNA-binding GntR family transcriptional regulator